MENKKYDLIDRTEIFALKTRDFCVLLKKDIINIEYIKQLVRASGSVAANYIEANEKLGDKDFLFREREKLIDGDSTKGWKHVEELIVKAEKEGWISKHSDPNPGSNEYEPPSKTKSLWDM